MAARRKNIQGEESRRRILDTARAIAAERGYEATSIALVCEACGLPASSIYWHFRDKDGLFAAIIEDSFADWTEAMRLSPARRKGETRQQFLERQLQLTGQALAASPDFLRLGLMLSLERRPTELTARKAFLRVRAKAIDNAADSYQTLFGIGRPHALALARSVMIADDGIFIMREIEGPAFDVAEAFRLAAVSLVAVQKDLAKQTEPAQI